MTGPATSPAAESTGATATRPLGLWRVEWLRLTRSPRGISLLAVYLFFGAVVR
jgi:hypothetical protein